MVWFMTTVGFSVNQGLKRWEGWYSDYFSTFCVVDKGMVPVVVLAEMIVVGVVVLAEVARLHPLQPVRFDFF